MGELDEELRRRRQQEKASLKRVAKIESRLRRFVRQRVKES